jgi:hypothetical protein
MKARLGHLGMNESAGRRQQRLDSWADVPIGTLVQVTRDDGKVEKHPTRSHPWMLCGTPVIKLEGISGGYALCRCTVADPPKLTKSQRMELQRLSQVPQTTYEVQRSLVDLGLARFEEHYNYETCVITDAGKARL